MSKFVKHYNSISDATSAADLISPNLTGVYVGGDQKILWKSSTRGSKLQIEGTTLENLHYVESVSKHTITYDSAIGAGWISSATSPAPTEVTDGDPLHVYTYDPVPPSILYVDVMMGDELMGKCDLQTGDCMGCITLEEGLVEEGYVIYVDIDSVTDDVRIIRNV